MRNHEISDHTHINTFLSWTKEKITPGISYLTLFSLSDSYFHMLTFTAFSGLWLLPTYQTFRNQSSFDQTRGNHLFSWPFWYNDEGWTSGHTCWFLLLLEIERCFNFVEGDVKSWSLNMCKKPDASIER